MRPLWIWQTVDVRSFLRLLNARTPRELASAIPKNSGHLSDRQTAIHVFRECVDEWLNSGFHGGVDDPPRRSMDTSNSELALQVFLFCTRGKLLLLPNSQRSGLTLHIDEDETAEWMTNIVLVRRYLTVMMLSDLSLKLAKCRIPECGKYFLLKKPSRRYKRGTRCEKCSGEYRTAAAKKLTVDDREKAKKKLCGLLIPAFSREIKKHPEWHHDHDFKDSIARYLSHQIKRDPELKRIYFQRPRNGITRSWVTRNWRAIDFAVTGRKAE